MRLRAVVDTNVLFEELTKRGGASGLVITAWATEPFTACVSTARAFEYVDVLPRRLSQMGWRQVEPILKALLNKAEFVPIHYSWRPSVPDPDDDRVVDCVMNAGAMLVTHNARDFVRASHTLGFEVVSAIDFVTRLAGKADE